MVLVMIWDPDFVARKSEFTSREPASVISDGVSLERLAVRCENEILFISLCRPALAAAKIMVPLRPVRKVALRLARSPQKNHRIRNQGPFGSLVAVHEHQESIPC